MKKLRGVSNGKCCFNILILITLIVSTVYGTKWFILLTFNSVGSDETKGFELKTWYFIQAVVFLVITHTITAILTALLTYLIGAGCYMYLTERNRHRAARFEDEAGAY